MKRYLRFLFCSLAMLSTMGQSGLVAKFNFFQPKYQRAKPKPKPIHSVEFILYPKRQSMFALNYGYRSSTYPNKGLVVDLNLIGLTYYYHNHKDLYQIEHGYFLNALLMPFPQFFYRVNCKDSLREVVTLSIGKQTDQLVGMIGLQLHYRKYKLHAEEDNILSLMWDVGGYLLEGKNLTQLLRFSFIASSEKGSLRLGIDPNAEYYIDHFQAKISKLIEDKSNGIFQSFAFTYFDAQRKSLGLEISLNPFNPNLYNRTDKTFSNYYKGSLYRFQVTLAGVPHLSEVRQIPFSISWQLTALAGGAPTDQVYQVGLPIEFKLLPSRKNTLFFIAIPYVGYYNAHIQTAEGSDPLSEQKRGFSVNFRIGFRKKF